VARRRSKHGYDQRVEVVGRSGQVVTADNPVKSTVVRRLPDGNLHDCMSYTFDDRYEKSYVDEIDHFVNLVLGKEGEKVEGSRFEESFVVSLITDAALKSAETGKVVVFKHK